MAKISLELETRGYDKTKDEMPIKIRIGHKGKTAHILTGLKVKLAEWDKHSGKVIYGQKNIAKAKRYNAILSQMLEDSQIAYIDIIKNKDPDSLTVQQLRDKIKSIIMSNGDKQKEDKRPKFSAHFRKYANSRLKLSTTNCYLFTLDRIHDFMTERNKGDVEKLHFEDITKDWLLEFQSWLMTPNVEKGTKGNTLNSCNVHFRAIRAVFNDAIDEDLTTAYPFRKFKMKSIKTEKRSLTANQLRELFDYACEEYQQKYIDYFKLIFMLCGINLIDLANLKEISNDGRIVYNRSKTYRLYSIKVEPEALEIINKYRGKNWLVDIRDNYANHKDFMHYMNKGLQQIGTGSRQGKKRDINATSLFPGLTSYWARHSWATIAYNDLGISKDIIAQALGHGGTSVTDIYLDKDLRLIDEANRRVLDWVLYGKK